MVSIHALLAECDPYRLPQHKVIHSFNPRTPCGVRPGGLFPGVMPSRFQSTHSLRSATFTGYATQNNDPFQSTHSLRSATNMFWLIGEAERVSIHALLAECDTSPGTHPAWHPGFNPRTPCGVRHHCLLPGNGNLRFQSTHSLRSATVIMPHLLSLPSRFQSTHSLRSATRASDGETKLTYNVSIHALLAECDQPLWGGRRLRNRFNPRTPCGVRQQ